MKSENQYQQEYYSRRYAGKKVTIMGLGLHGGGLNSALFFARQGANVTITDLKSAEQLAVSVTQLKDYPIRYVLGKHEPGDFTSTNLVIKNPAVPDTSPFLKMASEAGVPIETDLSIFLRENAFRGKGGSPIIAITGSKGKSTTSSAIFHGLKKMYPQARLGGNITISPLSFLDELAADKNATAAPVVLELSSWQLADLKGKEILKPGISVITHLMPDHLNRYNSMEDYIKDKQIIYQEQDPGQFSLFNLDDPYQKDFPQDAKTNCFFFSGKALPANVYGAFLTDKQASGEGVLWLPDTKLLPILPARLNIPGEHNRMNLLAAGLALSLFSLPAELIYEALGEFRGIEHRLEFVREFHGIRFYNDSAATIPEASMAAARAFPAPVFLIMGGTDKNLDFTPFKAVAHLPQEIFLLKGSATTKFIGTLEEAGRAYRGPFNSLKEIISEVLKHAVPGTSCVFTPGCASFELFLNEFDRGRQFRELVLAL